MDRDQVIRRAQSESRRATGDIPGAIRQSFYQEQLRDDLGLNGDPKRFARFDENYESDKATLGQLLIRPFTIFMLSVLMFLVMLTAMLWRAGVVQSYIPTQSAEIVKDPKRWLLGGHPEPVEEDTGRNQTSAAVGDGGPELIAEPLTKAPSPAPPDTDRDDESAEK
jgi:hypothetical protein